MIFYSVTDFLEQVFVKGVAGKLYPADVIGYFRNDYTVLFDAEDMVRLFRDPVVVFDAGYLLAKLKAVQFFFGFHNAR